MIPVLIVRVGTAAGLTWSTSEILTKLATIGFALGVLHALSGDFPFKDFVTIATGTFASPAWVQSSVSGTVRLNTEPSFTEKLVAIDDGTLFAAIILGVGVFFVVRYGVEWLKDNLG